jgi:hypothetical protein
MTDLILFVLNRLLECLPVGGLERARDLGEDLLRDRLGDIAEILGIERQQQVNEDVAWRRFDEPIANNAGNLDEGETRLFLRGLLPDQPPIVCPKGFEDECEVRAVHRTDALSQFGEILSMLQALEEILLRSFLAMRQRFEDAVLVEQARHLGEALLETCFGSDGCHARCLSNDDSTRIRQTCCEW